MNINPTNAREEYLLGQLSEAYNLIEQWKALAKEYRAAHDGLVARQQVITSLWDGSDELIGKLIKERDELLEATSASRSAR